MFICTFAVWYLMVFEICDGGHGPLWNLLRALSYDPVFTLFQQYFSAIEQYISSHNKLAQAKFQRSEQGLCI